MATGDPTFRNDLRKDGYSQEEKYFHELNRELINERQKKSRPSSSHASKTDADADSAQPEHHGVIFRLLKKIFGTREGSEDLF